MADERLRNLERTWQLSGDPRDHARFVRERRRQANAPEQVFERTMIRVAAACARSLGITAREAAQHIGVVLNSFALAAVDTARVAREFNAAMEQVGKLLKEDSRKFDALRKLKDDDDA